MVFDFAAKGVTGAPKGITVDSKGYIWVACSGNDIVSVLILFARLPYDLPGDSSTRLVAGRFRVEEHPQCIMVFFDFNL